MIVIRIWYFHTNLRVEVVLGEIFSMAGRIGTVLRTPRPLPCLLYCATPHRPPHPAPQAEVCRLVQAEFPAVCVPMDGYHLYRFGPPPLRSAAGGVS